jgi:hypothetical protein
VTLLWVLTSRTLTFDISEESPYQSTVLYYAYVKNQERTFFYGEGPRSRRYGRTAALRLSVQPCDEDDDDDDYFCPFPSNGAPVE